MIIIIIIIIIIIMIIIIIRLTDFEYQSIVPRSTIE